MSTSETEPVLSIWASMATWFTPTPLFLLLNLMIITVAVAAYFTSSKPDAQNNPTHRLLRRPSFADRFKSVNFSFNRADLDPVEIFQDVQRIDKLDQTQSLDSDVYQTHQNFRAPSLLERAKSWKFSFNDDKTESSERFQNTENYDNLEQIQFGNTENYDNLEQTQFGNSDVAPRRTSHSLLERVKSLKLSLRLFEEKTERNSDQYRGNSLPAPAIRNKIESGEILLKARQAAIGNKMSSGAMPEFGTEQGSGKLPAIENRMSSGDMSLKMTKSASEKLKMDVKEVETVEHRRPETMRERNSEDDSVNDKADDFITNFRQQLKLQRLNSMVRYREMIDRGSSQ